MTERDGDICLSLSLTVSCLSVCLSVSQGKRFMYYPNPELFPLNREAPDVPYRFKPGGVIAVEVSHPGSHPGSQTGAVTFVNKSKMSDLCVSMATLRART